MAHFVSSMAILAKNKVFTSLPVQSDFSEWIAGSVYSDQVGKLEVQESFDLPVVPSATTYREAGLNFAEVMKKWSEEGHWAPCSWPEYLEEAKRPATFTTTAKVPLDFSVFSGAPYWRLVYTNSGVDQTEFRLFARAFEQGKL